MNWLYLIKHWFSTLLIAPILSDVINYYYTDIETLFNLTTVYPITVIFGLFFSLPTYFIIGLTYYALNKKGVNSNNIKLFILIVCSIGIIISFYIIFNDREKNIALAYLVTSIFFGLFYKIENNETNKNK